MSGRMVRLGDVLALALIVGCVSPANGENRVQHRKFTGPKYSEEEAAAKIKEFTLTAAHNVLFCGQECLANSEFQMYNTCTNASFTLLNNQLSKYEAYVDARHIDDSRSLIESLVQLQSDVAWNAPASPIAAESNLGQAEQEAFAECWADYVANISFCSNANPGDSAALERCYQAADRTLNNCVDQIGSDDDDDEVDEPSEPTE